MRKYIKIWNSVLDSGTDIAECTNIVSTFTTPSNTEKLLEITSARGGLRDFTPRFAFFGRI